MEVKLRFMTASDLPQTLAWRNRDDVRCWFFNSDLISPEQHEDWWYTQGQYDQMFIIQADGVDCGQVALYNWARGDNEIEFGRMMIGEERYRGNGVGLAAVKRAVDWAFYRQSISRVYLRVLDHNRRAKDIYVQAGFRTVSLDGDVRLMDRWRP